ncbi:MAG: hypothetical protein OXU37_08755 [Thaumarchaeota archaeon]|nr:hypothetical protein [Nitrososphaerota archaeon]MDD9814331.1 hypothetical protein [Nitrososphaerota archaeon]
MASILDGIGKYMASAPSADEARGTIGPVIAALCAVSRPAAAPHRDWRRALGISFEDICDEHEASGGAERLRAVGRRMGVHALVYLAKRKFGCPGLDAYGFFISFSDGVSSTRLDLAIDSLDSLGSPAGMEWDRHGRFASLLRERGADHEWLSIAALICMMDDVMRTRGDDPGRNDLLEEAHLECSRFARRRLSDVHDDLQGLGLLEQGVPVPLLRA